MCGVYCMMMMYVSVLHFLDRLVYAFLQIAVTQQAAKTSRLAGICGKKIMLNTEIILCFVFFISLVFMCRFCTMIFNWL